MQTPTVGRVVHYHSYGSPGGEFKPQPRAAIVTEVGRDGDGVDPTIVGLCVLNPTGQYFNRNCAYSETPKPGCWSWPPRV
jgi:hypothetical protein